MALLKSIDTESGVATIYWNIGSIQENFRGKCTDVLCYGYVSQEARESGKQPLNSFHLYFAGYDYVAGADRAALYSIIKQRPEFEGAEDA